MECIGQNKIIFQVGDYYHFDLFHVERFPCSSKLYIETRSVNFTNEELPMDYAIDLEENFHVDGIVATMDLTDHFSLGPNYDINIFQGNCYSYQGNSNTLESHFYNFLGITFTISR